MSNEIIFYKLQTDEQLPSDENAISVAKDSNELTRLYVGSNLVGESINKLSVNKSKMGIVGFYIKAIDVENGYIYASQDECFDVQILAKDEVPSDSFVSNISYGDTNYWKIHLAGSTYDRLQLYYDGEGGLAKFSLYHSELPEELASVDELTQRYVEMNEMIQSGVRYVDTRSYMYMDPMDNFPNWIEPQGIFISSFGTISAGEHCQARESFSVAVGERCIAQGKNSFAHGRASLANSGAFASGYGCLAHGNYSFAAGGQNTADGIASVALGNGTRALGDYSMSVGKYTVANGHSSYAEGWGGVTGNGTPHVVNTDSTEGFFAHVEGNSCQAKGNSSHAQGIQTLAGAKASFSSGYRTKALGEYSFSGGCWNYEGSNEVDTTASGKAAFAYGLGVQSTGKGSVALGIVTKSQNEGTFVSGGYNVATNIYSNCLGKNNTAGGNYSSCIGYSNITNASHQVAIGYYNTADKIGTRTPLFMIGNGSENERKNAFTVCTDGTTYVSGSVDVSSGSVYAQNLFTNGTNISKLYAAKSHTHSYVPTSRTVNGKSLASNISLTAADVSAIGITHSALGENNDLTVIATYANAVTKYINHDYNLYTKFVNEIVEAAQTLVGSMNHGLFVTLDSGDLIYLQSPQLKSYVGSPDSTLNSTNAYVIKAQSITDMYLRCFYLTVSIHTVSYMDNNGHSYNTDVSFQTNYRNSSGESTVQLYTATTYFDVSAFSS